MKLDKTLEEITLYNNSLQDSKFKIAKEYFILRETQDKKLSDLKIVHKDMKNAACSKIKECKNISIQNIMLKITSHKKLVNQKNIKEISINVYDSVIKSFTYSSSQYYENNKDKILDFIIELYKIHLEYKSLQAELNSVLKEFIKENEINTYVLKALVTLYNSTKENLAIYKKHCDNIDEFKKFKKEKDELSTIAEERFLLGVEKIHSNRELISICNNTNKKNIFEYLLANAAETLEPTKIQSKEIEKSVEESMLNNKETMSYMNKLSEEPPKKEKVKKSKLTKEERAIKKANKAIYTRVTSSMYGGLVKC